MVGDYETDLIYTKNIGQHEYLMIPRDYGLGLLLNDVKASILQLFEKYNLQREAAALIQVVNKKNNLLRVRLPLNHFDNLKALSNPADLLHRFALAVPVPVSTPILHRVYIFVFFPPPSAFFSPNFQNRSLNLIVLEYGSTCKTTKIIG